MPPVPSERFSTMRRWLGRREKNERRNCPMTHLKHTLAAAAAFGVLALAPTGASAIPNGLPSISQAAPSNIEEFLGLRPASLLVAARRVSRLRLAASWGWRRRGRRW